MEFILDIMSISHLYIFVSSLDQGMLYVNGDLMSRFTFIDSQLIYFLIGGVALTLAHIFTEVEET